MSDHTKYLSDVPLGRLYPIAETFYSVQGEGYWTGTPAFFIRLAGCSVGCSWCDTAYGKKHEEYARELIATAKREAARHVVITGGEPTDHDLTDLVDGLRAAGKFVQLETSGCRPVLAKFDWITVSPKCPADLLGQKSGDECKVVFAWPRAWIPAYLQLGFKHFFIQPLATHDKTNAAEALEYVKAHPQWRLSLQTHKVLGVQ
jgi:7-carboxy-7-deazaguanine synthase